MIFSLDCSKVKRNCDEIFRVYIQIKNRKASQIVVIVWLYSRTCWYRCTTFHSFIPHSDCLFISTRKSNFFISLLFLQNLERKEKHQALQLEQLTKKQIFLKWRCEQLISYNEALCKRRSVSECSTSTISSTNSYELTRSSSSICESGEFTQIYIQICAQMSVSNMQIYWQSHCTL
jgi:hypothetical protein